MTKKELNELNINTSDGVFSPKYTYDKYDVETGEYLNLVITQTAEEHYREWLANKNKVIKPQPTEVELLKQQLLETQAQLANLQEQILLNNGGMQ